MKKYSTIIALMSILLLIPNLVLAAPCPEFAITPPTGYPLPCLIIWFFTLALTFSGVIFFTLLLIAGLTYLTSSGSPERLQNARSRINSAFLGVIILFFSATVLYFVNPELLRLAEVGLVVEEREPEFLPKARLSKYSFTGNHDCDTNPVLCCPPDIVKRVVYRSPYTYTYITKINWEMCMKEEVAEDQVFYDRRSIIGRDVGWIHGGQKDCNGWVNGSEGKAGDTFNPGGELTRFHRFTCNRVLRVWCCSDGIPVTTYIRQLSP